VKLAFEGTQLLDSFEQRTSIGPFLPKTASEKRTALLEILLQAASAQSFALDGALAPRCWNRGNRLAIPRALAKFAQDGAVQFTGTPLFLTTIRFVQFFLQQKRWDGLRVGGAMIPMGAEFRT
jgi:hypothetical protein